MIFSLSDKPIRLTIPPVVIHDRVWGAPVAQLDRASDYGSEGLEFDSLRVYHFYCLFFSFTSADFQIFTKIFTKKCIFGRFL